MASHTLYSLLFLVAYTLSCYTYLLWLIFDFFLLGGMKMSGSAGLFNKKKIVPRREPKGGRSGRWETHKKYGHPNCDSLGRTGL